MILYKFAFVSARLRLFAILLLFGACPWAFRAAAAPAYWDGSVSQVGPVVFGGAPFCKYQVTLQNVKMSLVLDGAQSTSSVECLVVEAGLFGCPLAVFPPNLHRYTASGGAITVNGNQVQVTYTANAANAPVCALVFTGSQAGNFLTGTLSWHRIDQPSPLDWSAATSISLTGPTATIADAYWSDEVDQDSDGFVRSARLNWNVDVLGGGSLAVFEKIYSKRTENSTWNLIRTTAVHSITGTTSADAQLTDVTSESHGTYDWRIEVYRDQQPNPDFIRDFTNDTDLNSHPMETAGQDTYKVARPIFGPVLNPANNHLYYLIDFSGWLEATVVASNLGGALATVRNQAEQDWIFQTFSQYGGVARNLWIGLYDQNDAVNSPQLTTRRNEFGWYNQEFSFFTEWLSTEPKANGFYVYMSAPQSGTDSLWIASDENDPGINSPETPFNAVAEALPPPPSNDNFESPAPLTGSNIDIGGTNIGATQQNGEPQHTFATAPAGHSVWYTWTAPSTGGVTLEVSDVPGGALLQTPIIAVYTGSQLGSIVKIASDASAFSKARLRFTAQSGVNYRIVVDGSDFPAENSSASEFRLTLALAPPPANDNFASRTSIGDNYYVTTGSFAGAGREPSEPAHGPNTYPETVWWTWTAPDNGLPVTEVSLAADSTSLPPDLAVYKGNSLGALQAVPLNLRKDGMSTLATFSATPGTAYQIALAGRQHDAIGNILSQSFGTYHFRLNNRAITLNISNLTKDTSEAVNYSATANIANLSTFPTKPLRLRVSVLSGGSFLATDPGGGEFGVYSQTDYDLSATGLQPGQNKSLAFNGVIPAPIGKFGDSVGLGYGAYAELQEQAGANWYTVDQQLITFGQWPDIGETPGPGGGVIRLDPGYVGLSAFNPLKKVEISGPASIQEGTVANYEGIATYSDGAANHFTQTAWSATPISTIANGVFTPGSVNTDTAVTLQAKYSYGGLIYTGSKNVMVTDTAALPTTITWTPAGINYGTPLGPNQLNATANVPGNFVYSPPIGTILNAGPQTLTVAFTPSDSRYQRNSSSVVVLVGKAIPTITWSTPGDINYPTPLGPGQLNAAANVNGSFSYSPGPGTVLPTGAQTLNTVFTSSDPNYDNASASVSLQVRKGIQLITFDLPGTGVEGSTITLNGTASSGLDVSYTVIGLGTISGNTLKLTGPGTVSVTAVQNGNDNYFPAAPVQRTISVFGNTIRLAAEADENSIVISIPAVPLGFVLEDSTSLAPGATWRQVPGVLPSSQVGLTVTIPARAAQKYYRLRKP